MKKVIFFLMIVLFHFGRSSENQEYPSDSFYLIDKSILISDLDDFLSPSTAYASTGHPDEKKLIDALKIKWNGPVASLYFVLLIKFKNNSMPNEILKNPSLLDNVVQGTILLSTIDEEEIETIKLQANNYQYNCDKVIYIQNDKQPSSLYMFSIKNGYISLSYKLFVPSRLLDNLRVSSKVFVAKEYVDPEGISSYFTGDVFYHAPSTCSYRK